jgi:pentalenolactone synthase
MTTSDSVLQLPFPRDDIFDIAPQARELLRTRQITRVRTLVGDEAWLVTGYALVKQLFKDERLGRSHPEPESAPRVSNFFLGGGPIGDFETEKDVRNRFRKLLSSAFSPRRMQVLEKRVQDIVDMLLDDMERQERPVDLHASFSALLPAYVICELLGVPVADRDMFTRWVHALDNVHDAERSAAAYMELADYMSQAIEAKRARPGEDVISDLIAAEQEWNLTPDDMVRAAAGLLFGGYRGPANTINHGTVFLLLHPDQKDLILADPSLIPTATEELLRFLPLGTRFGLLRYARTSISVGGVTIKPGEAVLLMNSVANRDPSVFDDPDRLDVTRQDNPHLAMGGGMQYCLGASLARVQLKVAFKTLFQRFPTLRLAEPVANLELSTDQLAERLIRVPVTW